MNLLIDENIAQRIIDRLRLDGHTLTLAVDIAPGQPDTAIVALGQRLGAIVLTEDTDFGELVMHQRLPSAGVILLRLSGMAHAAQPEYVAHMLSVHAPLLGRPLHRIHANFYPHPAAPLERVMNLISRGSPGGARDRRRR